MVVLPLEELSAEQVEMTDKVFPNTKYFKFVGRKNSLVDKVRNEIDPYFTNTHGVSVEPAAQDFLNCSIDEGAIIWFFGTRIANAFELPDSARVILDIDDIQSQYWRSCFQQATKWSEKLKSLRKIFQWERRESVLLNRFQTLCVCSESDQHLLTRKGLSLERVAVLPNGFSLDEGVSSATRQRSDTIHIGFIGTLQYKPNVDGVMWYIEHVWPRVLKVFPNVKLRLVGAETDKVTGNQVDGLGFVDDVDHEISQWALTIVPIQVGGGTRIKIAEAFCRRCPVVSTSLGAFGYDVTDQKELMLADTAEDFAAACIKLIQEPSLAKAMTERARSLYDRGLSWQSLEPRLESIIRTLNVERTQSGTT